MIFIHNIIKIRYSQEGYLPNYPYHLISDGEMCDAFLYYPTVDDLDEVDPNTSIEDQLWEAFQTSERVMYFKDNYPYPFNGCERGGKLVAEYRKLVEAINWHIQRLKSSVTDEYELPDWVYSYMLGAVIGPMSDKRDIHDLLVLLGTDNTDDDFNDWCAQASNRASIFWMSKIPEETQKHRPPTIFGEPHVIKYLRLREVDLLTEV